MTVATRPRSRTIAQARADGAAEASRIAMLAPRPRDLELEQLGAKFMARDGSDSLARLDRIVALRDEWRTLREHNTVGMPLDRYVEIGLQNGAQTAVAGSPALVHMRARSQPVVADQAQRAAHFSAEWQQLNEHRATSLSRERYVELALARATS
jgi:hypothetical protein